MSELPDVYAEQGDDGYTNIVANKKARRFINKCFDAPAPRWSKTSWDDPRYRAIGIEDGPVPHAILGHCYQAGLSAAFLCCDCHKLHVVNDETAQRFVRQAGALATRETLQ
jgi:hypothetical protein